MAVFSCDREDWKTFVAARVSVWIIARAATGGSFAALSIIADDVEGRASLGCSRLIAPVRHGNILESEHLTGIDRLALDRLGRCRRAFARTAALEKLEGRGRDDPMEVIGRWRNSDQATGAIDVE